MGNYQSKKIVISGWYGFGNIGDEAILQAMINTFEKEWKGCEITVLSFNPEYTMKTQKINSVYQIPISGVKVWMKNIALLRWVKTLKAIKECEVFIMGGGGFLSDWQPEAPVGWLKQMRIAKFFGKKTMLYGIGAGPFLTEKGKNDTKYYIDNFVDEITVRDKTSLKNLQMLDLISLVTLTEDPVMSLEINSADNRQDVIGVNFVELFKYKSFYQTEDKLKIYIKSLKKILAYIQYNYKNYKLEFVSFYECDRDFYKKYFDEFGLDIIEPIEYGDLVKHLNRYKLFIGTRFHSLIFSIRTNTPTIGIVYHHKSLDLCKKYNIDYEIVSDGSLPPLESRDIDTSKIINSIEGIMK